MSLVRLLPIAALLLLASGSQAFTATLVSWNFNDDNAVPDSLGLNVTSTNFLAGAGLTPALNDNAAARGWNPSGSAEAAFVNNDYWTFTVTATPGYVFDLTALQFDQWRGEKGPVAFRVYAGATPTGSVGTSAPSSTPYLTDLSSFTNLSSATLYLVAWGAENNGATANWFIDNVELTGNVRAVDQGCQENCGGGENGGGTGNVPEPASLVLLGLGLLGAGTARRRTRQ